ncbi:hypothetical protein B7494_g1573 [Chlorociboria aeruginascens]|nr:hypothetical protein B7494_g1573 [Chlorociboria aeruginascens]
MDPAYTSDSEDESAAMAAAMGFSTFGSHKPAFKKRKFNPATDAFVDGQDLISLDKGGNKGQGSGGNNVPLGRQRVIGVKENQEIELGDDEEVRHRGEEGEGVGEGEGEEEGPRYLDTSEDAPIEEARKAQERIDAILAASTVISTSPTIPNPIPPSFPPAPGTVPNLPNLPRSQNLSQRFASGAEGFAPGTGGSGRGTWGDTASVASSKGRGRGRGERNPDWYIGYYDKSFNENPWRRLELEKGLEEKGRWIDG